MGWEPEDERIPRSLEIAEQAGVELSFYQADLKDAHPNTAVIHMTGAGGRELEVIAASIGGGGIRICRGGRSDSKCVGEYPSTYRS